MKLINAQREVSLSLSFAPLWAAAVPVERNVDIEEAEVEDRWGKPAEASCGLDSERMHHPESCYARVDLREREREGFVLANTLE